MNFKKTYMLLLIFFVLIMILLSCSKHQEDVKIDLSTANDIFENSLNNKKIKFEFQVENMTEITSLLSDISKMENSNILHSEQKNAYNLTVFEIPTDISDEMITKFRSIVGISNENIQKAGMVLVNTNLKENLNNNQIAKKRVQNLINESVSPDRITSFRNQLDMIQSKIDSLSIQEDINKHNAVFDLVMLSAIKNTKGNDVLRGSLTIFILTTIVSLILIIVGLIISYYIFVIMHKLMLVLGIRTTRGEGSNYNYNKKGYGRKVKRIYKDSEGKVIKKEEKD